MIQRILYLLSFLLLFYLAAEAQTTSESELVDEIINQPMIGIMGGITLNSISGDSPTNFSYGSSLKFMFGLNGEIPVGNGIKICLQPRYLQSGTKLLFDAGKDITVDSMRADINYISVPVFIKILAFNDVTYFTSGLDFSYLLNANVKNLIDESVPVKDIAYALQNFDLQMFFGVGVRFKIGMPELNIEARYSKGVTNLFNGDNILQSSLPARFTLGGFQILANINFPLTNKSSKSVSKK